MSDNHIRGRLQKKTSNFVLNLFPADQGGALSVLSWVQSDVKQGLHRQRGHLCSCGAVEQDVQE